jgi:hypothetical protein
VKQRSITASLSMLAPALGEGILGGNEVPALANLGDLLLASQAEIAANATPASSASATARRCA